MEDKKTNIQSYTTKISLFSVVIAFMFFIITLVSGYSANSIVFALSYAFGAFSVLIFIFGLCFALMEENTQDKDNDKEEK